MPSLPIRHLNLRTKSAIYVLLLIGVIFTTTSLVLYTSVHREMLDQLGEENLRLTKGLATAAATPVLLKDLSELTDQMQQMRDNPAVRTAEVVDTRGIIVASTELAHLGQTHAGALALLRRYQQNGDLSQLASTPPCCPLREELYAPVAVQNHLLGLAYLHMDDKRLTHVVSQRLDATLQKLMLLGLLTALLGIVGSYIVSGFVTRPVLRLANEVEKMKARLRLPPQDEGPAPTPSGDEIARLQEGFYQLETRLNQYLDELEQLHRKQQTIQCLATIGEMSAQVAHEIRNALSSLRGAARYLARFGHFGDKQEFVQIIEEEVQRLYNMTEGFLDFGRPYKVFPVRSDVCDIIQHSVQRHQNDLEQKQIQLSVRCHAGLQLTLDGNLVEQALSNLILNAIDALPTGGRIEIGASPEGPDGVLISVRDNGPGIDAGKAQEVFKPYVTTKAKGSGLGLAVVAKIAMVHDGYVELRPSPKGAHFALHLKSIAAAETIHDKTADSYR
ncbi:MAG: sensor histidine kinase [Pseudomonadota bacterium]|uniref:sensor histidine kinase n=1 Tax=Thermithiobacillus tepidarius TaxID=929 RepID=UPI000409FB34|nr:ATP-binding protein [Thermithiobacillus tepidarius]